MAPNPRGNDTQRLVILEKLAAALFQRCNPRFVMTEGLGQDVVCFCVQRNRINAITRHGVERRVLFVQVFRKQVPSFCLLLGMLIPRYYLDYAGCKKPRGKLLRLGDEMGIAHTSVLLEFNLHISNLARAAAFIFANRT
ncbi:hypothetical protein SAMN05421759_1138 [Roseivivax lentus]|uniref:Uncharacterized protein n=1 Tax=Roseivivax lentus TaxID=633194 RepID=A0A1N7P624_9RHOB|nr:hypothetical protein SAMN05421759_1138 [Roseivivax lentus]